MISGWQIKAKQVSTTGLVDTTQQPGPPKRRQYSEALKHQMVAETQAPGASVSIVARRHDVNGIVNLSGRGMLLVSVARQLGSENSFARLSCCPAQAERGWKEASSVR
jgi:hypothetical protein